MTAPAGLPRDLGRAIALAKLGITVTYISGTFPRARVAFLDALDLGGYDRANHQGLILEYGVGAVHFCSGSGQSSLAGRRGYHVFTSDIRGDLKNACNARNQDFLRRCASDPSWPDWFLDQIRAVKAPAAPPRKRIPPWVAWAVVIAGVFLAGILAQ